MGAVKYIHRGKKLAIFQEQVFKTKEWVSLSIFWKGAKFPLICIWTCTCKKIPNPRKWYSFSESSHCALRRKKFPTTCFYISKLQLAVSENATSKYDCHKSDLVLKL